MRAEGCEDRADDADVIGKEREVEKANLQVGALPCGCGVNPAWTAGVNRRA